MDPTRILILEDSPLDYEMEVRELRRAGLEFVARRVETQHEFENELRSFDPNVILADYNLPTFDGLSALMVRKTLRPDVPFIFVSGSLGEELAVETLRSGATDYVLKSRLSRLSPAVDRALAERKERLERVAATRELEHRAALQHLIATLSTRFINLTAEELDQEVESALQLLGEFENVSRAYVFLMTEDNRRANMIYEWAPDGVERQKNRMQDLPMTRYAWALEQMSNQSYFYVHDVDQLPPEAAEVREILKSRGVVTAVGVPMRLRGRMIGYVGFDITDEVRDWSRETIVLLTLAAEIFASAIERTRVTAQLSSEREFVSRIIDTAGSYIVVLDWKGRLRRVNPAFAAATGYSIEDASSMEVFDFIVREDRECAGRVFRDGLSTPIRDFPASLVTRSGEIRKVIWQTAPFGANGGQFVVGIGHDITEKLRADEERERLKAKLEQTRRLDSIGRLAATITHEFNNVLMGIKPYVRVLERRFGGDEQIVQIAQRLGNSVARGERITQEILRYASPAQVSLEPVDLSQWLESLTSELSVGMPPGFDIHLKIDGRQTTIQADAHQLHQVFSNLIYNARDAMPSGGEILIRVQEATSVASDDGSKFLQVTVQDNGPGIPPESLPHIFEPLFTTKKSGTGLGLAVSYQIVTAHGGYIIAESEQEKGTSFHLYFPLFQESEKVSEGARASARPRA